MQSKQDFNVLIVYDGFVSGQLAAQTYDRLMLQHGDRADVKLKTWTFDLLKNHKINRTAIEDAAEAQLIILAAACEELPPAVENWLQGWLSHPKKCRGSFVAVRDSSSQCDEELSPVENELQSVVPGTGSRFWIERTAEWYNWDVLAAVTAA